MKFNVFSQISILYILSIVFGAALLALLLSYTENYDVTPYRIDFFAESFYLAFNKPPALLDLVAK